VLVILGCVVFLLRRNIAKVNRLASKELDNWPKTDANLILVFEILLMSAFLTMNAADFKLQQLGQQAYPLAGSFPISQYIASLLPNAPDTLIFIERFCWSFHCIGVSFFLIYLLIFHYLF